MMESGVENVSAETVMREKYDVVVGGDGLVIRWKHATRNLSK